MLKKSKQIRLHPFIPWVAAIAFFMQALDGTILNTAIPSIASDLGHPPLAMQSVVVAYTITLAIFIPVSGWLSDKFGSRTIFCIAVGLFILGSLFCALSQNLSQLVLSRILQGMGGSIMVPVARLTILYVYPKDRLLKVLNFIAIPGLAGAIVGPALGGWLVELATWHWIFLINLPIGMIAVWIAYKFMPEIKKPSGKFDVPGFLMFSGSLSLLTFGLEIISSGTMKLQFIILIFLVSILLIVLYVFYANKKSNPLIDLSLFKIRTLRVGLLGNLATRLGIGGFPLLLPLMLQVGFGYEPAAAGMMLLPMAIANVASKPMVVPVIKKFGHKKTLVVNTLLLAILLSLFAFLNPSSSLIIILPLLVLYGIISSIQFTTMNTISIADLDESNSSDGNSLVAVAQQLSISFGVSIAGLLVLNFSKIETIQNAGNTFTYTFIILGILTAISTIVFGRLKPYDGGKLSGKTEGVKK